MILRSETYFLFKSLNAIMYSFLFVLALLGQIGHHCQDRVDNCATKRVLLGKDFCTSKYTMVRTWAQENCKEFCGLCQGKLHKITQYCCIVLDN